MNTTQNGEASLPASPCSTNWTCNFDESPTTTGRYAVRCRDQNNEEWETLASWEDNEWYFSMEDACRASFSQVTHFASVLSNVEVCHGGQESQPTQKSHE